MTSSNKVSSVQHRANNIVDPTLFSTAVVLVLSLDTQLTSANTNWMHHYNFVFSLSIKQQHEKHHLKILNHLLQKVADPQKRCATNK